MDLLSLGFRSINLDSFLRIESDDVSDMDDSKARERKQKRIPSRKDSRDELRAITLDEVAWHDSLDDCWLVIHDYVYDCTEFIRSHPGGQDVLLEYAGRDATLAFIGTGHSAVARTALEQYKIGELPLEERIFRVPNGVKVLGF
ncbi:cytochrome b5 isoform X2 [Pseudomyrmex gracilis]|nr:cytochrome b5 isoform X2 [Pseudomyrmex gracilis]XP_020277727.1 cytochrome b5 isoform X2 [Pseudomyrmex gracilis]